MAPVIKELKFCGKPLTTEELDLIKDLAEDFWGISRTELANTVCELLSWERSNGKSKTVECIQFLDELEKLEIIGLPKKRSAGRQASKGIARTKQGESRELIIGSPGHLKGLVFEPVTTNEQRRLFKELVDRYHYLGYKQPFGAHLRYLVRCRKEGRLLACLQYSSPAWKVKARDQWIGWDNKLREKNLQQIIQNSRFLILPWVNMKGLASHILGQVNKHIGDDWVSLYRHRPLLLETFVDQKFRGTSYLAANWIKLGETRGRGRMDRKHRHTEPIKTVWVYPLHRRARELLRSS